jgi:hypothetical protein
MDTLQNFIDGRWTDAPQSAPAINPATGQQIERLPKNDRAIDRDAIAAAKQARAGWAKTSVWKRAEMCVAIAASIDEAARIAHAKPGAGQAAFQATGEVAKAADGFRLAAELVRQMKGETLPAEDPTKLVMTLRQLRGVYAVITPWNYPVNIPVSIWDLDSPPAIRSSGFPRRRLRWPPSSSCERSRLRPTCRRLNLVIGEGPSLAMRSSRIPTQRGSASPAVQRPGGASRSAARANRCCSNSAATGLCSY